MLMPWSWPRESQDVEAVEVTLPLPTPRLVDSNVGVSSVE